MGSLGNCCSIHLSYGGAPSPVCFCLQKSIGLYLPAQCLIRWRICREHAISKRAGRALIRLRARIGTMNRVLGAPISRSAHSGHATPRRAGARRSGSWVACTPFLSRIGTMNLKYVSSSESSQVSSGSWRASTSYLARIGTMNRGGFVAQAFEPAGSGDFPVARSWSTGLESPVNPQAGKPALQAGSWVASFRFSHALGHEPMAIPLTRPSDTLSPSEGVSV